MLETLITSKTRIKLLLKFFLNKNSASYLRNLANEFHESSNAIRVELNKFEDAGLLNANMNGNKKIFKANTSHPLFEDIHNILKKFMGLDMIIEKVIRKLGGLNAAYLVGDIAKGKESGIIDLVLVGENIDRNYLNRLIDKTEKLVTRKIRFLINDENEMKLFLEKQNNDEILLLWKKSE